MTDPQPAPDPAPAPPAAEPALAQRVDGLESKVDKLLSMFSGPGGDNQPAVPEPGQDVAAQIRAQLDERDKANAAKAKEDQRDSTITELKAKLSELTEKAPGPLPRRVEKIMGWS